LKEKLKKWKNSIKEYVKANVLFLSFVVFSVINSSLLRFFTVQNYFSINPILADLAVVLIIGSFSYFIKPKRRFIYFISWICLFTLLCIINSMYYTNYISFSSISLLATSLQLVDVADAVTQNVMELKDFTYLWAPLALIIVHLILKKRNYYLHNDEKHKYYFKKGLVMSLICVCLFVLMLKPTDISRIHKQWNREYLVARFGLYTYHINDLIQSVQPKLQSLFGYDKKAKLFRDFYDNRDYVHEDNEYTNIFEGKNLLMIHAESIQSFVMDLKFNGLEVTPNLNKLASEGMFFSNFYSQESVGTSSDSEFTLNTSLLPASNGTVFVSYWDREFVTIPKLLKEKNYYAFSMHGNVGDFWNRNHVHEQFGYDKFYSKSDYEIDEIVGLGLSDKSFFKQSVPKIKEIASTNQNFYGTVIMLSNHTPFDDLEAYGDYSVNFKYEKLNEETGKYETVVDPYLEDTKLGNYIKSVHYADEALGEFIVQLDEAGLLDNTVIVIYGDHDAKIKKKEFQNFYNYDPYTGEILSEDDENYRDISYYDYELNRKVPFIIWTKNQEFNIEVDEVMGMYDILPTLGNMFNFESPYQLGHDIFSVDENIVVFPSGNWLTKKIYYNNQRGEYMPLTNDPISDNYIAKNTEHAEGLLDVSDAIIIYDLIRKTKEQEEMLEDYKEEIVYG